MTKEERMKNRERKKAFIAWVNAKLDDYLMGFDDEDGCYCFLFFKRGEEEQIKCRSWSKREYTGRDISDIAESRMDHMLDVIRQYKDIEERRNANERSTIYRHVPTAER